MIIFVDADGCPVVDISIRVAKENNIHIVIVKNYAVVINNDYAEIVTVDILISQDHGLAAMCIAKGAICINQNGYIIDTNNIDGMLNRRHLNQKLRRE